MLLFQSPRAGLPMLIEAPIWVQAQWQSAMFDLVTWAKPVRTETDVAEYMLGCRGYGLCPVGHPFHYLPVLVIVVALVAVMLA